MLESRDFIKLNDGNTYAVISSTKDNNKLYYYIMDIHNKDNYKFCYEEKNNDTLILVEENNTEQLKRLVRLFASNLRKEIKILEE